MLKRFYEGIKIELNPKVCILVDVAARRIYTLDEVANAREQLNKASTLIQDNWDLIYF